MTEKRGRLKVRKAESQDVEALYQCQVAAYPGLPASGLCDRRLLSMQIEAFPDGILLAVSGDRVLGYATSLIVQLDEDTPSFSYDEITGGGTFTTHDPSGDTLYGADIAVHPEHRGRGVAGRLYKARKQLLRRFNLRRMVAGGRIPGYKAVSGRYSPEEYVELVSQGKLSDSALNAHLKAGYVVRGVHLGYLHDEQSLDFATILEYANPDFRPERRRIAAAPMKRPVRKVRFCSAQVGVQPLASFDEFEERARFFLRMAGSYHAHFLVFPELPTIGLLGPDEALESLADHTQRYRDFFQQAAVDTGMFIVAGSHPVAVEGELFNSAHLFTPGGKCHTQEKLHLTPNDRRNHLTPGQELRVFDTGHARIGILVGYDIMFPELARLLTLAGAEILVVPFSARERHDYLRVRHTSQARAVENVVYTVLASSVGELPRQAPGHYGEAVIFTPCDFAFPADGIAASAGFSGQTVVIADLDLGALNEAREVGTVRPLRDRRSDFFKVSSNPAVEQVRTH